MDRPVLEILICSTRPGRVGLPVAEWFSEEAKAHGAFAVELIDLAEVNLPFLDEPSHPRLGQYLHEHTKTWSATISRADAIVMVVPEYNFGFNAVTKNAIDYLHHEWHYKPIGFVSYGGVAAGTRAVQMLKQVVTALRMVPVYESVNIPFVQQLFDDAGLLHANETMGSAADAMLDELLHLHSALRALRS
ncbi:MAG: NAD(P)H-dependent oxidoreductase [Actinobacteria bacterium]|nr:NAD(P)H-dependent oxidoreductase [Actinomycetota bacterium]